MSPLDVAMRLLKGFPYEFIEDEDEPDPDDPSRKKWRLDPDEQIWGDEADEHLREITRQQQDYLWNLPPEQKLWFIRAHGDPLLGPQLDNAMLEASDENIPEMAEPRNPFSTQEDFDAYKDMDPDILNNFLIEAMLDSYGQGMTAMEGLFDREPVERRNKHFVDMEGNSLGYKPYMSTDALDDEPSGRPIGRSHAIDPHQWRKWASEPMDIAMRLLKQGLELQPPPTQGVEEKIPTQEEMPIVDAKMKDYESECECAESERDILVQQLMMITEIAGTPEDKSRVEEYIDFLQQASCQELLQVEIIRGKCDKDTGFDQADQTKYAGEPMDLAMQLLKDETRHPDFEEWADDVRANPDYEGVTEGWTEEGHQFVSQAQSLEDFYNRIHHLSSHYKHNVDKYPFQYELPEPTNILEEGGRQDFRDWRNLTNHPDYEPFGFGVDEAWQEENKGEPMEIALRLLKDESSDPTEPNPDWVPYQEPTKSWPPEGSHLNERPPRPFATLPYYELERLVEGRGMEEVMSPEEMQFLDENPEISELLTNEMSLRYKENTPVQLDESVMQENPWGAPAKVDETTFQQDFQDKLTGEPMDIAMRLLKDDDVNGFRDIDDENDADAWMGDESPEHFERMKEQGYPKGGPPKEPADFLRDFIERHTLPRTYHLPNPTHPNTPAEVSPTAHPGDEGELAAAIEGSRTYFPTVRTHPDATLGIQRRVQHDDPDVGTFRGTPFDEATDFTTGEPMDMAMQLLKMPVYDTDAGVQFVTRGKGENWKDDPNVYGRAASEGPIEMMTPNDYLQWWDGGALYGEGKKTPRELGFAQEPHGYKTRFDEAEDNPDIKFGMPYLGFVGDDPEPRIHDGRHRMIELKERGHGDTPLPVRVNREGVSVRDMMRG